MNGMTRSTRGGKAVCVEEDFWNVKFLGVVMDENPDVFQVFSLLMMLSFYLSHVLEKDGSVFFASRPLFTDFSLSLLCL